MKNIKTYEEYKEVGVPFLDYVYSEYKDKDFSKITIITVNDYNIINLDGINKLSNLEELYCQRNLLTSLEGIEESTKLTWLNCDRNRITSIKGIENLKSLFLFYCWDNPIDWVDYVDKQGNTWYIQLPKSIQHLSSNKFLSIEKYREFMDKNQPASVSRKFNF